MLMWSCCCSVNLTNGFTLTTSVGSSVVLAVSILMNPKPPPALSWCSSSLLIFCSYRGDPPFRTTFYLACLSRDEIGREPHAQHICCSFSRRVV